MKGTNLGELEEIILLVIANLQNQAYGLAIRNFIKKNCNRSVSLSTVHATIHRLERKGYLTSKYDNSNTGDRGGRPKLLFTMTSIGRQSLEINRELRNSLWNTIPSLSFSDFQV